MPRRKILVVAALLGLLTIGSLAVRALSFNQTQKIASDLVLRTSGEIDEIAIAGALNARFPIGAPAGGLTQLAKHLDGTCGYITSESLGACGAAYISRPAGCEIKDKLSCTITTAGTICIASKLGFEVKVRGGLTVKSRLFIDAFDKQFWFFLLPGFERLDG